MADAEQLTLRAIKKYCPEDWHVIYSLWIKRHEYKQHAEIDFVIITEEAVLLLEVKGSQVYPHPDGTWQIGTRKEEEGPFDQARSAYYAIQSHIIEHASKDLFFNRVWGYGVVLPECTLNLDQRDPAVDSVMLLDKRDFPERFPEYISKLTDYWKSENARLKENRGFSIESLRTISKSDRDLICSLLSPLHRPGLSASFNAREAELELIRLTDEQCRILQAFSHERPLVIQGAAGTGKTLLALQQIHRRAQLGDRILFVCFNRLLAEYIHRLIPVEFTEQVQVFNYHQLLTWLNGEAGIQHEKTESWPEFNAAVDQRFMYALEKLDAKGFEPFDHIVIDEAQDLMTAPFMDSLELLLQSGWKDGNWTMSIDPRQTIFQDQFDERVFQSFQSIGTPCSLNTNCRNTKPVAAYAHGLSKTDGVPTRVADGPMPEIVWYKDWKVYQKKLKECVNGLIDQMKDLSDESRHITILGFKHSDLPAKIFEKGYFKQPVDEIGPTKNGDRIQAGTLQSFKGLESAAVVLVGLEDLDADSSKQLVYVGGTRAKVFLTIILQESMQAELSDRMSNILELLRKGTERDTCTKKLF